MTLQTRLGDLILAVGTDYKQIRTWLTGSASGTLTGLTTSDKSSIIAAINEVKLNATGAPPASTEAVAGVSKVATQAQTTAGTEDVAHVTPLKLLQKLTAWAQPLSANLTTLSGVASGAFGRTLLTSTDATAAKSSLGLATVATSGNAADLTGTLSTAQLPPLAINETFTAANQAAMLALTAQRGDVAIRSDQGGKMYILASDSPSTLADWKPIVGSGEVTSVAGKVGAVTLNKSDVGLDQADNVSDANKLVSTAQAAADALRLLKTANLSDLADASAARTNLSVYSKAELGDPETDLVASYTAAKA